MKRFIALILLMFFALPQAWALFDEDEPLMPDEAFKLKAYAIAPNMIRAEWEIVDGYYLYRHKFKFTTTSEDVTLGTPVYPKGEIHNDEFFGDVESYRKKVVIEIPIQRSQEVLLSLKLDTVSQGCADIGICYPPQKVSQTFALIPPDDDSVNLSASQIGSLATLSSLTQGLGLSQQEEFLSVDKAFVFSSEVTNGNEILVEWDIAKGYYLYRDKFEFSIVDGAGVTIGEISYPKGEEILDDLFGKMVVYRKQVSLQIPLNRMVTSPIDMSLRIKYQGCADAGFCYPPVVTEMGMSLPEGNSGDGSKNNSAPKAKTTTQSASSGALSEQDSIAASLEEGSIMGILLTFFGFGLLLAFTPCVFPMVPILSSIIVGQGGEVTTRKALTMSIVYVLAMALTYTVAGIIAGLFGANLQATFQSPWILISFSMVFVALSFSMFGFYELQLPSSIQSKLTAYSNNQKGGTLAGVAIMGFLSALIVGPCVAAPLMGALIYIGQTGDAVLGGLALFSLSMGMGAPLIAIGASAGKLLPKAGGWMDAIKAVFGVMLLAVAIWMLERVLPGAVALLLWATLLIVSAIFMGALSTLGETVSGWRKLWKGLGLVLLIYGGLLLVGVANNSSDPLQPLRGISMGGGSGGGGAANSGQHAMSFKTIKSIEDLDREVALAASQNKGVMLDFYADWCISCKEMERYTFSDAAVINELSNAVLLQADVTANDDIDRALLKKFRLVGPPSMIFWDKHGVEQPNKRLVGFMDAKEFAPHVKEVFR